METLAIVALMLLVLLVAGVLLSIVCIQNPILALVIGVVIVFLSVQLARKIDR